MMRCHIFFVKMHLLWHDRRNYEIQIVWPILTREGVLLLQPDGVSVIT